MSHFLLLLEQISISSSSLQLFEILHHLKSGCSDAKEVLQSELGEPQKTICMTQMQISLAKDTVTGTTCCFQNELQALSFISKHGNKTENLNIY